MTNTKTMNQVRGKQNRMIGQLMETIIDGSCRWYRNHNIAIIEKTPEPMKVIRPLKGTQFICCFLKKAQPDYKGTIKGGQTIVMEAKHTDKDRIESKRVSEQQQESLENYRQMGAITYILVSFRLEHYYMIPWVIWKNMKEAFGRNYVMEEELKGYKVPYKNGIIRFLQIED